MSSIPTTPSSTGESWETIAEARRHVAGALDHLITATIDCDCGNETNGLKHYDAAGSVALTRYPDYVLAGLVAEAVCRLAGLAAGERS